MSGKILKKSRESLKQSVWALVEQAYQQGRQDALEDLRKVFAKKPL
jgi:hypothetical protein